MKLLKITVICGLLAITLTLFIVPELNSADQSNTDVLAQALGGTAEIASEKAFEQADLYYHAGNMHKCPDEDHEKPENEEHSALSGLFMAGFVNNIYAQTKPHKHVHIEGASEKELIPWFVTATRLNPHNIEAWRVGSYWYMRTGETEHAREFIADAIRKNPEDYRLYLDQGIVYHHFHEWKKAVSSLETADKLWKDNSEDAPYDLRAIKRYLKDSESHLNN